MAGKITVELTLLEADSLHFLAWSTAEQRDIYCTVLTEAQRRRAADRAMNKLNRAITRAEAGSH